MWQYNRLRTKFDNWIDHYNTIIDQQSFNRDNKHNRWRRHINFSRKCDRSIQYEQWKHSRSSFNHNWHLQHCIVLQFCQHLWEPHSSRTIQLLQCNTWPYDNIQWWHSEGGHIRNRHCNSVNINGALDHTLDQRFSNILQRSLEFPVQLDLNTHITDMQREHNTILWYGILFGPTQHHCHNITIVNVESSTSSNHQLNHNN